MMMTFDAIAVSLLHEHGFEVLRCPSEQDAIKKAKNLRNPHRICALFSGRMRSMSIVLVYKNVVVC